MTAAPPAFAAEEGDNLDHFTLKQSKTSKIDITYRHFRYEVGNH